MALSAPFHGSHTQISQPLPSQFSRFSLQAVAWPSTLSPDAERDLTQRVWTGDEDARETLFTANMRLVFFVARRYTVPDALSFDDLVQWGAMGLWEAIHRFDPTRQTKFSTYAVFWIRQAIGRALDNTATLIRVPVHQRQRLASRDHQADPSPLTPADACAVHAMTPLQSFDAPLDEDDPDSSLYTAYPDSVLSDPLELVTAVDDAQERHHLIAQALATLPERTARILAWYTGWPDQEPQSLAAIARRLSLSSERVRQIVQQGLAQLRQMPTLALLDTEGEP
jgi:RNA polymerase primary sigma factor